MEKTEVKNTEQVQEESKPSKFQQVWNQIGFGQAVDHTSFSKHLVFILFIAFLGWVHIANNHKAIKYVREINTLEHQLKELRWEYMTTKSDLMFKSKQSEVAKAVDQQGIKELVDPPYIINRNERK